MAGYITAQRKMLLEFLEKNHDKRLSASQIANSLKNDGISVSAVYRNLASLEAQGVINRSAKEGTREIFYQYTNSNECKNCIHLTCTKCGRVTHMDNTTAKKMSDALKKTSGFNINKNKTVVFGVCDNCSRWKMKIKAIILTLIIMCCTLFCGCSNTNNKESSKIKIVTTSFSAYDWTRNILGDELNDTELTLLSDNGVDMHSYQPTADDIINIQSSDLIIVVGGSSDEWVLKSVKNAKKNIKIINMLDLLGENVLYNNESNHEHNSHADHNHKNDDLPDEHVWLSLKNSILFSNEIFKALSEINSNSATVYQENFNAYKDRLSSLDSKYRNYFDSTNNKSIIIADRFPFRYLIADYSLHYLALFEGCSAESDATIDSILNLSKQIDSNGLNYVFIIEGSNEKTAKAVIEHTKSKTQEILVLNSLQSVTKKDIKNGLSYYSVMEENLSLIYKSLK